MTRTCCIWSAVSRTLSLVFCAPCATPSADARHPATAIKAMAARAPKNIVPERFASQVSRRGHRPKFMAFGIQPDDAPALHYHGGRDRWKGCERDRGQKDGYSCGA